MTAPASLRSRLFLALAIGGTLLLAAGGAVLAERLGATALHEFDAALLTRANSLAALIEQEDGRIEFDYVARFMPSFERDDNPEYFQIWLTDGTLLLRSRQLHHDLAAAPTGPLPLDTPPHHADLTTADGRVLRICSITVLPRIPAEDPDEGAEEPANGEVSRLQLMLAVASSRQDLDRRLAEMHLLIGGIGAALLLLAAVIAWRIIGSALRPIDQITAQVRRLQPDAVAQRIGVPDLPVELRPIVDQLNALLNRLHEAMVRERCFSANAAHELRTPVAELRSLAAVGARWPDDRVLVTQFFTDVAEVAVRMDTILGDLLLLARCEAGTEQTSVGTLDLTALLATTWTQVCVRRGEHPWQFDTCGGTTIVGDEGRLRIVLANVLDNAQSHALPGSEIRCQIAAGEHAVSVTVRNAAAPLPPGDLARLTEPFWRRDDARPTGDHAGLGLALVAALARVLKIQVAFAQAANGEFCVTLTIPRMPASANVPTNPPTVMTKNPLRRVSSFLLAALPLVFCSCGAEVRPGRATLEPPADRTHEPFISHPYLPMRRGMTWTLASEPDSGDRREEFVIGEPIMIAGTTCVSRMQEVYVAGKLTEYTTEWFAESTDGAVWQFGEESWIAHETGFERSEDSWIVGENGAEPALVMPATPQVGQVFFAVRPHGTDVFAVLAMDGKASTPAGDFDECLELAENPGTPEEDLVLYAPGVGAVAQQDREGKLVLIGSSTPR